MFIRLVIIIIIIVILAMNSIFLHGSPTSSNDDVPSGREEQKEELKSFSCRLESVKVVVELLTAMCLDVNRDQECLIEATQESLLVKVTGRVKSFQVVILTLDTLYSYPASIFFII